MQDVLQKRAFSSAVKTAVIYFILSVIWVVATDRLVAIYVKNPQLNLNLQTIKGWLFVVVTTIFLFVILWRERKYYEDSIRAEEKFHSLFDAMAEGVAIHEMIYDDKGKAIDYRILDINPAYRVHTNISTDVVGRLATEVYKVSPAPYIDKYLRVIKEKRTIIFESYFEPLKKIFRVSVSWMGNSCFATLFEDITDQKKIIEALRESEEKYSTVFQSSPYIIIMTRAEDGKIVEVNDAFTRLSGYTHKEALENTSVGLELWANIKDRTAALEEIKNGENIVNREYLFRKKNGTILTGSFSAQIIQVKGMPYILAIVEDISVRKATEEALAKVNSDVLNEKHKLEAILQDMGDAVFVTDGEKNIILVNRAMKDLFGLSEKEMYGKKIEEALALSYETTGEKPTDLIQTVFEKKRQVKPVNPLVIRHKNGMKVSVDGMASPILSSGGVLTGTVWVLRDVSKEKELEKMRLDFISLASHQLRTPLTGIKWFVELLEEDAPKMTMEKVQEYIKRIGESSSRMIDLVNDLLTTSRADSGRLAKDVGSYSVKDMFQQAIDAQGRVFIDKKIRVTGVSEIPSNLEMDADVVQIGQVMGNLLNNAASYSPEGSKIEVEVEQLGEKIRMTVKDHGIGIPVNQQSKVFEKFFRADNVSRTIPGTGLGLYVAKSMVEAHGGKIWFKSKENEGTTFFVELPIKQKNGKKESDDRGG